MGFIKNVWNIIGRGRSVVKDEIFIDTNIKTEQELLKKPNRTTIINYLLTLTKAENYLEIGVRNPDTNFNKIKSKNKYSVDPGLEEETNQADFKLTSDDFFKSLANNSLDGLDYSIKFDVIFIDGLHTSIQVDKDISNSLKYLKNDGFIVLHDCNPPTEYHQRENYSFKNSPANLFWNGTTWKAFYKYRHEKDLFSICFDTDWGVGVISRKKFTMFSNISKNLENSYFEYSEFSKNRTEHLNLVNFEIWKSKI